jgi:hypothetical protein
VIVLKSARICARAPFASSSNIISFPLTGEPEKQTETN